jgi:hypothetical protein
MSSQLVAAENVGGIKSSNEGKILVVTKIPKLEIVKIKK